jgi:DNA (cytosine-5)-methyltransferase 1
LLGWTGDETPKHGFEVVPTLRAFQGGEGVGVIGVDLFRKLTPLEHERLQGLPDRYTQVNGSSDRQRIRAIGNSFCVAVLRWIGTRITELDR